MKKGPLSDDDKGWLDGWLRAHPPKPPKVKPTVMEEDEVIPEGPQPKMSAPPKVEPDPPAPRKGEKGEKATKGGKAWRAKYKLPEVVLPNGQKLKPEEMRELVCVQVASVGCGILKVCEDGLALIGAKPYAGVTTDWVFNAAVLVLDDRLPDVQITPEGLLLGGAICILAPAAFNYKKVREALKANHAKTDREKRLEQMKRDTAEAERKAREEAERARRDAELQKPQAAPTQAEPPPAPAEVQPPVEDKPEAPRSAVAMAHAASLRDDEQRQLAAKHGLPDDAVW